MALLDGNISTSARDFSAKNINGRKYIVPVACSSAKRPERTAQPGSPKGILGYCPLSRAVRTHFVLRGYVGLRISPQTLPYCYRAIPLHPLLRGGGEGEECTAIQTLGREMRQSWAELLAISFLPRPYQSTCYVVDRPLVLHSELPRHP